MRHSLPRLPRRFWPQLLFWGGYCLLSLLLIRTYVALSSGMVTIMLVVCTGLLLASELLRAGVLRFSLLDRPARLLAWVLLMPPPLALLLQSLTHVLVGAAVRAGLVSFPPDTPPATWGAILGYTFNTSVMLWLWMGGWVCAQYLQRWRAGEVGKWRAEAERQRLQLALLQAQLNPHFLFNAINNVRSLILEDPMRARDMLGSLSNTLQHSLRQHEAATVPLTEELALVKDYLALQQLHHEQRLQIEWTVAPGCEGRSLPPLALQLLVENAIKHGIARTQGGGRLAIHIECDTQGALTLEVRNPGQLSEAAPGRREGGIGLQNLRHRLGTLAPPGQLSLAQVAGEVVARLQIPTQASTS